MVREDIALYDRVHAGHLLARKLVMHQHSQSMIVALAHGGAVVGFEIAQALALSFDVLPCRKIKHPGNSSQIIGSVSIEDVLIYEDILHIPQDYIYHQIMLARIGIEREYNFYYANQPRPSFTGKTVIVVDDVLEESAAVLACVRSIRKHKPAQLVVAVPLVKPEVLEHLTKEADDIVFLRCEAGADSLRTLYTELPTIKEDEVRALLVRAKTPQTKSLYSLL
ncbi:MAG TPA: phosphoribosyltransferase family protein [Ohtaekwangia sp.]|uniref:phosphoribosyltransferase n=1 Tax=Ohtaekwangia sp. TaxID=2066019 RepID=UPI002F933B78